MKKISYVYFDVGGVALFDFSGTSKWLEMRRDLGVTPEQDDVFDAVWKKYRNHICVDQDVDNLIPEFEKELNIKFPDNYSMLNDFVDRFERNLSISPVITAVKKKYKVGLLTNMYPRMLSAITEKGLLPNIAWDAVIDSSIVGAQKPEDQIFKIAEKTANVSSSEIFFIDNSEHNVVAAQEQGWQSVLYDPQDVEKSNQKITALLQI